MKNPSKSLMTKHLLEHSWTFWFDNPSAKSKQAGIYNNIYHSNKFAVGANFHCFKNKIEPKRKDFLCADGGRWTMTFDRGEQFDNGDEICGGNGQCYDQEYKSVKIDNFFKSKY
ncbi:hypothetical protein M9H77_06771 [Catharanthus roseus]|uniref:Uncharacterized protein n=1 Tax=Catharanthus roseus TaxID=4058 RepID=A0ACC0BTA4_CATRO|nr:hypothetical protein M9H77_06771 [Catharanthus roseus]